MGVPDDANPLNRRLPCETVSRKRAGPRAGSKEDEEAPLVTDPRTVLGMKAEQRLKWLSRALQRCEDGAVPAVKIYDIVTHTKFTFECPDKVGKKMLGAVKGNIELFSQKQQRFLQDRECRLQQLFAHWKAPKAEKDDEAPAGSAAGGSADDMMARIRAFAEKNEKEKEKADGGAAGGRGGGVDVAALWGRLTQLSAPAREEAVNELEPHTKAALEDFLVARITQSKATPATGSRSRSAEGGAAPAAEPEAPLRGSRSREASSPSQPQRRGKPEKGAREAKEDSKKAKEKADAKAKKDSKRKAKKGRDRKRRRSSSSGSWSSRSGSEERQPDRPAGPSAGQARSRSRSRSRRGSKRAR